MTEGNPFAMRISSRLSSTVIFPISVEERSLFAGGKHLPSLYGTPMDELFTRYIYYERAKKGITTTTTQSLRSFYETDKYVLLKTEITLANLEDLLHSGRVYIHRTTRCSQRKSSSFFTYSTMLPTGCGHILYPHITL